MIARLRFKTLSTPMRLGAHISTKQTRKDAAARE